MTGQRNEFWQMIKQTVPWRDLVLSVGTHKKNRRLTPIEIAKTLNEILSKAEIYGVSKEEIAQEIHLRDASMIYKFVGLLNIPEQYHKLIVFKGQKGKLTFSSVANATHLPEDEMIVFLEAILSYKLTRNETRNIKELKKRRDYSIEKCVDEVLLSRPTIEDKTMFIGLMVDDIFINILKEVPRNLKNIRFNNFLTDSMNEIHIDSSRISNNRFIIVMNNKDMLILDEIAASNNATVEEYIRKEFQNWWLNNVL